MKKVEKKILLFLLIPKFNNVLNYVSKHLKGQCYFYTKIMIFLNHNGFNIHFFS
jgi:hypothetical protein